MSENIDPKPVFIALHDHWSADEITPTQIAEAADRVHHVKGETMIFAGRTIQAGAAGRAKEMFMEACGKVRIFRWTEETSLAMSAAARAGRELANYIHHLGVTDDPRAATLIAIPDEITSSRNCRVAFLTAFDIQARVLLVPSEGMLAGKTADALTRALTDSMPAYRRSIEMEREDND